MVAAVTQNAHLSPAYSFNSNQLNNNVNAVIKLPSLEWTLGNKLFKDSSNSGINYYLKLNANIGDSIDLVCPKLVANAANQQDDDIDPMSNTQYSIIYKVGSKHEFDNCIINPNNEETVPILKCDKPAASSPVKFTIYFVKFSPVPNALEFEEDKEYFFISTSSGTKEGLNFMSGGLCAKYNMRFSIKIKSQQQPNHSKVNNGSSSILAKLVNKKEQQDESKNFVQFDYSDDSSIMSAGKIAGKLTKASSMAYTNADQSNQDGLREETLQPQVSKLNLVVSSSSHARLASVCSSSLINFVMLFSILFLHTSFLLNNCNFIIF